MDEIIVGVSGINAVDNPGPGIGVARSLKEAPDLNVRIVGLAYDAMEPGVYMDWLIDKAFIVPYPSSSQSEFLQRLYYIKENYGLDFVIPNLDSEYPIYIRYHNELAQKGIRTFLPNEEQFRLRAKDRLSGIAERIGLDYPPVESVSSYEGLSKAVEKIGLPVMVKGLFYQAQRAYTLQEAMIHYNQIVAEWGYPILIQRVVSGEEIGVVGVGDGKGHSLGIVAVKKLWLTKLGKIWTGVTIDNEKLLSAARKFIEVYNWKGGFEIECISDGDDIQLIEINPRLPAWSYFATGVGINLPVNMLKSALEQPVSVPESYEAGKLFVRYTYELVTDMEPFRKIITKGER